MVAEKEAALEKNRDEKSELLQKISSLEVKLQKYSKISSQIFCSKSFTTLKISRRKIFLLLKKLRVATVTSSSLFLHINFIKKLG